MPDAGRVALVTGANSGLGEAIARVLAEAGWQVGLVARRQERLLAVARNLEAKGGRVFVLAGDVQDAAFAAAAITELVRGGGHLDLLVNNAGVVSSPTEIVDDARFDEVFTVNVRAIYRWSHLALPHLQKSQGTIVNIGSAGVARNIPMDLPYMASKAAVEAMSRGIAKKWAPLGVRVNVVSPGMIPTEVFEAAGFPPDVARARIERGATLLQALSRRGTPDDVGRAVEFLASSRCGFVTGATLHVDGGMALGG